MNTVPMIDDPLGGRSIPEWIGATPDSKPPPRVRDRIFMRAGGRCYLSDRKIRPGEKWEAEHIQALGNGGENRERNLAPALVAPHKTKTKADRKVKAKTDAMRKKHHGIRGPRTITRWRRFDGSIVEAARER
jgi:hypothetical protein